MRLKEFRNDFNKTQEEIAAMIGITRGAYANIESGRREPDLKTLCTLSDYYGVSVDRLIDHPSADDSSFPLSQVEKQIIVAYRQANPADRQIIENITERYSPPTTGITAG